MAFQILDHEEQYYRQKLGQTTTVAIGAASTRSSQLQPGRYRLVPSVSCYLRQGGSSINAATTDMPLGANVEFILTVDGQRHSNGTDAWTDANDAADSYIAVIRNTTNGTLYITKQSDLQAPT